MSIYLDCNATSPIEPAVAELVRYYMEVEYGNSGSRTHIYGLNAKGAIEKARQQVADVVEAQKDEVVFTSGATESNNLAILGLAAALRDKGKTHIVTTAIEHKAVLVPCGFLESQGFTVSFLEPDSNGAISVEAVESAITESTGIISIMQVNNETGVIQPIAEIADLLDGSEIFFHVDAAQGFGKLLEPLTHSRIDLISVSAHKIYGPKGVGALIARRKNYKRPPLAPLIYGGGQEKGLRAGTLPVPLIAGFGLAAELAVTNNKEWWIHCEKIKESALISMKEIDFILHGKNTLPNVINFSVNGVNSEAAIVALKGVAAISNGSACTSSSYMPSHVLAGMKLDKDEIQGALRISWCHMTKEVPWQEIFSRLKSLL
jgi:cysteine desulfurase